MALHTSVLPQPSLPILLHPFQAHQQTGRTPGYTSWPSAVREQAVTKIISNNMLGSSEASIQTPFIAVRPESDCKWPDVNEHSSVIAAVQMMEDLRYWDDAGPLSCILWSQVDTRAVENSWADGKQPPCNYSTVAEIAIAACHSAGDNSWAGRRPHGARCCW